MSRCRSSTALHLALGNPFHHRLLRHSRLVLLVDAPASWREIRVIQIWEILALRRHPVLALPRLDAEDIHGVDLLQTSALRLADEEVYNNCTGEAAPCKHVPVAVIDGGGDEGG